MSVRYGWTNLMPNSDPRDGFIHPYLTLMIYSFSCTLFFFFFFFFFFQFNVPFKIISLIETSQSIGGAKREYPGKTT